VAALVLFGYVISLVRMPHRVREIGALPLMEQYQALEEPYTLAAYVIMAVTFVVAAIYCLDALHGERRDRSILFWKSLPVSDLTTVLAKATVPLVILPLLTLAVTLVIHALMLFLEGAVLAASGVSAPAAWAEMSFPRIWGLLAFHLIGIHALWFAPIYAWMLLVSAWARRVVLLWALLPPLAIGLVERFAFGSSHFAALIASRLSGGGAMSMRSEGDVLNPMTTHVSIGAFVTQPGLWVGLLVTAIFLAGAVRLRQRSGAL
jgi:ABC-2 type transport system permease protein